MARPTKGQLVQQAAIEAEACTARDDIPSQRMAPCYFDPLVEARVADGWVLMATIPMAGGFTRLLWRRVKRQ